MHKDATTLSNPFTAFTALSICERCEREMQGEGAGRPTAFLRGCYRPQGVGEVEETWSLWLHRYAWPPLERPERASRDHQCLCPPSECASPVRVTPGESCEHRCT